jgi:hypothetical protein
MATRQRLPNRRCSETFELIAGGLRYTVTLSRFKPAVYGRVYYETIFGDRFSSGFLYRIPPTFGDSESIRPPNPSYTDERKEN